MTAKVSKTKKTRKKVLRKSATKRKPSVRRMKNEDIHEMFKRFRQQTKEPLTELVYKTHFELLVAVVLSAQATDISVNKATAKLYKVANTPEAILKLGKTKLKSYIKTIGLFNAKAENILKTCRILIDRYDGEIPRTRDQLVELPGVGRKTANVILNNAFGEPTIAVDTHIFRVSNRTKLATGKTPLAVEKKLLKNVPEEFKLHAHHWLILHGRYTCLARKPKCEQCIVADLCSYPHKP